MLKQKMYYKVEHNICMNIKNNEFQRNLQQNTLNHISSPYRSL